MQNNIYVKLRNGLVVGPIEENTSGITIPIMTYSNRFKWWNNGKNFQDIPDFDIVEKFELIRANQDGGGMNTNVKTLTKAELEGA